MSRSLRILLGVLAFGGGVAHAAFPPYPELVGKYPSFSTWNTRLPLIWEGFKGRFISGGLVTATDPQNTTQNVSEAQAYGMLMATWFGDQSAFDQIWSKTESSFWNSGCGWYGWKLPLSGGCGGNGSYAPDADQDIAAALIFASALSDKGIWNKNDAYGTKAKVVLQSIWSNMVDKGNNYRMNSWNDAKGNDAIRNPSYHMPCWGPIFKEFAAANGLSGMDWDAAANGAFDLFDAQPNSTKGMAKNFSSGSGGGAGGGTSTPDVDHMGFDAIRVPFRVGLAAMWYPNTLPRAVKYAKSVWAAGAVDPNSPGMYDVNGPTLWGWSTNPPEYEQFMSRAMWGTLAASVQDSSPEAAAAFKTISGYMSANHVKNGLAYLNGANQDTTGVSSPARNYFAQSLGLLGALGTCGHAWNIWDDLKHPWTPPDTIPKITTALKATPATIQLTTSGTTAGTLNTTTITATWNRPVSWTLSFLGRTSKGTYKKTGTTSSVSFNWYSTLKDLLGKAYTTEVVDVHLSAPGYDTTKGTDFETTVTLTASTSVLPRQAAVAPFVTGGVLLRDHAWNGGDQVRTRVLDLSGREIQPNATSTLQAADNGVVVALSLPRGLNIRVLEVSDLSGTRASHYLISPNP